MSYSGFGLQDTWDVTWIKMDSNFKFHLTPNHFITYDVSQCLGHQILDITFVSFSKSFLRCIVDINFMRKFKPRKICNKFNK